MSVIGERNAEILGRNSNSLPTVGHESLMYCRKSGTGTASRNRRHTRVSKICVGITVKADGPQTPFMCGVVVTELKAVLPLLNLGTVCARRPRPLTAR